MLASNQYNSATPSHNHNNDYIRVVNVLAVITLFMK
jgi:hypothetical protein